MNASARNARRIIKARCNAHRDAKRSHTLASHGRLAGLSEADSAGVGGALRSKAKTCGITGEAARLFRRDHQGRKLWREPVRNARRYTLAEFAELAGAYNPRAPKYVAAKAVLLAYTGR